ncbi:uncharacterized protein LOC129773033 [Toxorhynchites rutilus septentrionalis]|uniref:uncharacterized protein LOC129773033 n=1 Tax=Toxorhynchites rutilus septentrionalis TaxID=329112 RepID=UPI0024787F3E|nr:uncharacterized protein LOC129773033 [Toxorhynchites rutilus septentrionalis]
MPDRPIHKPRSLNSVGDRILLEQLEPHKFGIVALQEICRKVEKVWEVRDGKAQFHQSGGATNELGTGFVVLGRMLDRVINWKAMNEKMCVLSIKGRFYNCPVVHCPHEGRPDDEKEAFYAQLEATYDSCSPRDIKIVIGDMNAQIGRKAMYRPVIGPCSLHTDTNDNGQRCINFAASRGLVIRSTFFSRKDIHKATWRSPDNIQQTKLTTSSSKADFSQTSLTYAPCALKDPQAAENYAHLLDEALPSSGELNASNLEDDWSKISFAIEETATAVLGEETTSPRNDWFDGECQQAMERSKTARKNYLSIATRKNLAKYRRARNKLITILRRKKRQQEDRDRDEQNNYFKLMIRASSMRRDEEGNLITSEREVVDKWQQFFDKRLNGEIVDGVPPTSRRSSEKSGC